MPTSRSKIVPDTSRSRILTTIDYNQSVINLMKKIGGSTDQDMSEISERKDSELSRDLESILDFFTSDGTGDIFHVFSLNKNIDNVFSKDDLFLLNERFRTEESMLDIIAEINSISLTNYYYMKDIYYIQPYQCLLIDGMTMFESPDNGRYFNGFDRFSIAEKQELATTVQEIESLTSIVPNYEKIRNKLMSQFLQNSSILK